MPFWQFFRNRLMDWIGYALFSPALTKPSVDSKNSFCFGFLWIPGTPGWLNWKWLVSLSIILVYRECVLLCIPTLFDICFHFPKTLLTWHFDWIEAISHWMFVHRIESKIESNTVKATQVLKSQPHKISARSDNIQTTVFSMGNKRCLNELKFCEVSFILDKQKILFLKK